jgi:hypothetical protein
MISFSKDSNLAQIKNQTQEVRFSPSFPLNKNHSSRERPKNTNFYFSTFQNPTNSNILIKLVENSVT